MYDCFVLVTTDLSFNQYSPTLKTAFILYSKENE